jgi:hypothetical protein
MKISTLLDELKEKDFFKRFMKENPDAFFAAGFFVLDNASSQDKHQVDYFIPAKKQIASAEYVFESMKIHEDTIADAKRLQIAKIDICDLREKVEEAKKLNNCSLKINKIIALLKDDLWTLTCLSDSLDMIKIVIDSVSGEIKKFEKVSFMSMMSIKRKD